MDHVSIPSSSSNPHNLPQPGDADYQPESAAIAKRQRAMIRQRPAADSEVKVDGPVVELGEFQNDPALSVSEARYVTDTVIAGRRKTGFQFSVTDIMRQMLNHMDTFSRFSDREQLQNLETLFVPYPQLNTFEKSQISSLVPGDHEEAKTLIPSLAEKMGDEELDQMLREIAAMREAQGKN
jgi:DNA-directed RNA polymerase II subunit RPB4